MAEQIPKPIAPFRAKSCEVLRTLIAALEESPSGVVITDLGGTIEYVNDAFAEMVGYVRNSLPGMNIAALSSAPDDSAVWSTLAAGRSWRGRFWAKRRNGELFWAAASISPVRDTNGDVAYYLGINENLTRQENPLNAGGVADHATVRDTVEYVAVTDLAGTILYINAVVAGLKISEVAGTSIYAYVPPEAQESLRAQAERAAAGLDDPPIVIAGVGSKGSTALYQVDAGRIEVDGSVVALVFACVDVTRPRAFHAASEGEFSDTEAPDDAEPVELSERELQVLHLLAQGQTNRQAAKELQLSPRTIEHHVSHILSKLDVANRTAAVVAAEQSGLLFKNSANE